MKATILITSFNRSKLLNYSLASLARQAFLQTEIEIVVLNDGQADDTESICMSYKDRLNIKYFYTGKDSTKWRVPGYAINYGVKKTDSDFIFISCAEMYHFDNTVQDMLNMLNVNNKLLTIPDIKDDSYGKFLQTLHTGRELIPIDYDSLGTLYNMHLPFFMGMNRKDFIDIGGYDEDFIGTGYDDNDIIERMCGVGNKHFKVNCRVVHLYHPRLTLAGENAERYKYNERLYLARRNIIKRNVGKNWGELI
jgi:glycosyltransferase involved in cell wall biosynthesis